MNSEKISGNIYLIGLMGAGKTTLGRLLARELGLSFVDSDREIEARTGVAIPTIFEIEGEEGFRRREAQVIGEFARADVQPRVVATGGGAVLWRENREAMRAGGFVAYLNVPPHVLFERVRRDRNRPLLQVENPLGRLKELLAVRDPLYRETAHLVIDNTRMSTRALLQLLIREVIKHWTP